ncbi:hypothetical protein COLO4_33612 [Corchorus olitorius]|uniref:Nucleolar GTP-binding protein 1 n=1 Tax=Corchorus olitorius TaxID=93759 RepID=A0A1R3GSI2_9ROSI|nr:hypothetical protein COLO4_33612 [Corchorus olitorius]
MVQYNNFKKITVVHNSKDFIDIILSRTQRQTPTVVHKGSGISRIQSFYRRKVKTTQKNCDDKLKTIIDEFPRLDEIHPFYGDLLHVLYNKDHYKLALGEISKARTRISKIDKDYKKLLKYGDSLYLCKSLKVAALGRMCTVIKRIGPSLAYLEQIRQHMARLPSIDPNTRTILICGPFEDRNIIEMCSITALAHLRAAVLFFLDLSGSCGYSIAQQAALFHSIKSLFMNKPVIIVCNKTDLQSLDDLSEEEMKLVKERQAEAMKSVMGQGGEEGVLMTMSTLTEDGVLNVKNAACERQFWKLKPIRKLQRKSTEKDLEEENGGAGVYSASLRKNYILANDEWKEDILPEILDGHNVYDFLDPDNLSRLEELDREEGFRQAEEDDADFGINGNELSPQEQEAMAAIRKKKNVPGEGFKDFAQKVKAHKLAKKSVKKRNKDARRGEADRVVPTLKPKHLFSGKRSIGKTQRR